MKLALNYRGLWSEFDRQALRTMRPRLIRIRNEHNVSIELYAESARRLGVRLWWVLPIELFSLPHTVAVTRRIYEDAADVTEAIEFGDRPWLYDQGAQDYATQVGAVHQAVDKGSARWILGTGVRAINGEGSIWLRKVVPLLSKELIEAIDAVGIQASTSGLAFSRFWLRMVCRMMRGQPGKPSAVSRVGWDLGESYSASTWQRLLKVSDPIVTPQVRHSWLIQAAKTAQEEGALYFAPDNSPRVEHATDDHVALYDHRNGRADSVWPALQVLLQEPISNASIMA